MIFEGWAACRELGRMVMAVVDMVRECIAATSNHHFDISWGFGGSLVGEIWIEWGIKMENNRSG
jgi:hypothetical protein